MAEGRYVHHPLDTSQRSIRLVEILPDSGDGRIRLSLTHRNLEEVAGRYNAVSYKWGSDEPSHKVWIAGRYILARDNIWRFLANGMPEEPGIELPSLLWIDSICIVQGACKEKNHQVQMMGEIFSQASNVLIWLGKDSNMEVYKQYCSIRPTNSLLQACNEQEYHCYGSYRIPIMRNRSAYLEVLSALHNPYWKRLWVVQEILLARQAWVVCGNRLVSVDDIRVTGDLRSRLTKEGYFHDIPSDDDLARSPIGMLIARTSGPRHRLGDLITALPHQECSELRDKVYGLLAMTDLRGTFQVDYEMPVEILFVRACDIITEEYKNFSVKGDVVIPWNAIATLACGLGVTEESIAGFAPRAPCHFARMVLEPSCLVQFAVTQMWQSSEELKHKAQIPSVWKPLPSLAEEDTPSSKGETIFLNCKSNTRYQWPEFLLELTASGLVTIKDIHVARNTDPGAKARTRLLAAIRSLTECYDSLWSRLDGSGSFESGHIDWSAEVEPMVALCFSAVDIIRIVETGTQLNKAAYEEFQSINSDDS
ncbi:hypothetical protein LTR70_007899 [Exophiala xenobiotica]|uniref:Heterokaryon incompatibility domain-containing protein n=1 Tax=Lithohypha guttulata TaxID=1690604 RepID=A0ABR0K8N5_9EURO|nr:hypothetical protein LTR24_005575 [Lithohypha guttulata]KAK5312904.1 hypothetical protein LTR70_007899 [Exophiala xenobiotica]